ncbi:hypothetical protein C0581_03810 [Candidatus Parcubacteria bacterium]|nr:MAG: hypothetical protein C0581_03810 [Candidatus Parcubacteria bacterium]
MNKTLWNLLVTALILTTFTPISNAKTTWVTSIGRGWVFVFDEDEIVYKPADTRLSIAAKFPVTDYAAVFVGGGLVIPDAELKPKPRVTAGIGFRVLDRISIGLGAFYQVSPPYNEKSLTHTIGGGVSLSVPINDVMSVSLAAGPAKTIGGPWSFVIKPSIGFKLPF